MGHYEAPLREKPRAKAPSQQSDVSKEDNKVKDNWTTHSASNAQLILGRLDSAHININYRSNRTNFKHLYTKNMK